jgi:hypothetical protein
MTVPSGPTRQGCKRALASPGRQHVSGTGGGDLEAGHSTVNEIRGDPGPSSHSSQRWGMLSKLQDGTIPTELDP